eukprot:TRINITY_DN54433_c0_g1_i1.p1 TRINITY_DN54433_c0_g1~~TRINITY_DN54433_c0_g1_i1.p1  ORF type:complete len:367 (-),score=54.47 TRINITY_DN54433_c0_g1_i1:395-1417(-)
MVRSEYSDFSDATDESDEDLDECKCCKCCKCCRKCCQAKKCPRTVSGLIHFLVVELRPAFLFYFSSYSLIKKMFKEVETTRSLYYDWCAQGVNLTETMDCIEFGAKHLMFSLYNPNFSETCERGMFTKSVNLAGRFNLSAAVITVAFLVTMITHFCLEGAWDFKSGEYLCFTWKLEGTTVYRVSSSILMLCTFVGCFMAILLAANAVPGAELGMDVWALLKTSGADLGLLLYSSYLFTQGADPIIDYNVKKSDFSKLRFKRSWLDMFIQSNDKFGTELTLAILQGEWGDFKALEETIENFDGNIQRFRDIKKQRVKMGGRRPVYLGHDDDDSDSKELRWH